MKLVLKPLQWIYCLYAFALFLAIMLLILPFVILSLFFGRIKGGNMIMGLCRIWADLWFFLVFIYVRRIQEAPHDRRISYIFVTNHISYLDAAIIPKAFRQPVRPLGKVEMGRVPLFGLIYRNAIVAVDRSNAVNRAQSIRILKSILGKGISVLVFPEGTFNMSTHPLKEFYDGAFRLAIETQTPIKPVLFLDAYRRLPYESIFRLNPGRCRILYLDEVPVKGYATADTGKLKREVYTIMESKLREYQASWKKSGSGESKEPDKN